MANFITESSFKDELDNVQTFLDAANNKLEIIKTKDKIIFTSNYVACPRIAYIIKNNKFVFDLGNKGILNFLENEYPSDMYKDENSLEEPYSLFINSIKKGYFFNHVGYIENWKRVIVYPDGSFEKEAYPLELYSVDINQAFNIFKEWIIKYKYIVRDELKRDNFIPTITGGLDTRYLSYFWFNHYAKNEFYCREMKNDGKNHVELGKADLDCAIMVAKKLNLDNNLNRIPSGKITLSGMYTEANRGMYGMPINDVRFVYKFIQHKICGNSLIMPFTDDLFLKIKQPNKNVFRVLMALIFCPDLLDLPLIGTQKMFDENNHRPYYFYEYYADYIDEAKNIIKSWGYDNAYQLLKEIEKW